MALLLWFLSMEALLPADILTLQQALAAAQLHVAAVELRADEAEARAANVLAINADLLARNALLELQNAKMQRALYGPRSERSARLIAQLELAFEDLDADAAEAERLAAQAAAKTTGPARRAATFLRICRVSALSLQRPAIAFAVARTDWRSSARM